MDIDRDFFDFLILDLPILHDHDSPTERVKYVSKKTFGLRLQDRKFLDPNGSVVVIFTVVCSMP